MNRYLFKKSTAKTRFEMGDDEWMPSFVNGKKTACIKPKGFPHGGASIEAHEISANGDVDPSVEVITTHGDKYFHFHEFITLEGWSPEVQKGAQA